jgi:hypothetical protein
MKKIPSLFARDGAILTSAYNAVALWVVEGEGVATRKWDGTAVRWANGKLWARYDAKLGKLLPDGFVACQDPDPITGHRPGWVPATRPEDKWIREAAGDTRWQDGTYEACGPRIGGNPEKLDKHTLIRHGTVELPAPRDFAGLVKFFREHEIEGIVWWRDSTNVDCDKVKITGEALGVSRHEVAR